jgi:hypothetical protein
MTATINIQCIPTPALYIASGSVVVPANALKDESGNPIKDENGNFILTE